MRGSEYIRIVWLNAQLFFVSVRGDLNLFYLMCMRLRMALLVSQTWNTANTHHRSMTLNLGDIAAIPSIGWCDLIEWVQKISAIKLPAFYILSIWVWLVGLSTLLFINRSRSVSKREDKLLLALGYSLQLLLGWWLHLGWAWHLTLFIRQWHLSHNFSNLLRFCHLFLSL